MATLTLAESLAILRSSKARLDRAHAEASKAIDAAREATKEHDAAMDAYSAAKSTFLDLALSTNQEITS